MNISLSAAEIALAQSCAAALPPLVSAYEAAPVMGQDAVRSQLAAVMTDAARALFLRLASNDAATLLATVTAAFQPYFNTPLAAQTAAGQSDAVRAANAARDLAYVDVFSVSKAAAVRFAQVTN